MAVGQIAAQGTGGDLHGPVAGRLAVVVDAGAVAAGHIDGQGAACHGQRCAASGTVVVDTGAVARRVATEGAGAYGHRPVATVTLVEDAAAAVIAGPIPTQGAVGNLHGPGARRRTAVEDTAAPAAGH